MLRIVKAYSRRRRKVIDQGKWTQNVGRSVERSGEYKAHLEKDLKEKKVQMAKANWKARQIQKIKAHRAIAARTQRQGQRNQTGVSCTEVNPREDTGRTNETQ